MNDFHVVRHIQYACMREHRNVSTHLTYREVRPPHEWIKRIGFVTQNVTGTWRHSARTHTHSSPSDNNQRRMRRRHGLCIRFWNWGIRTANHSYAFPHHSDAASYTHTSSICILHISTALTRHDIRQCPCRCFFVRLELGIGFFFRAARLCESHHHHWRRRRTIDNGIFLFPIVSTRMIAFWAVPLLLSLPSSSLPPPPPSPLVPADTVLQADVSCLVRWLISTLYSDFLSSVPTRTPLSRSCSLPV